MREPDGRSKGCGIVEFDTPESAAAAMRYLNDTELDGRLIFVREDREDRDLKQGAANVRKTTLRQGGQRRHTKKEVGRRVFVNNLEFSTTWQDLKDHFRQVGPVQYADIMRDPNNNQRSKGCGIVEFQSADDALNAISQLSNSTLRGRHIMVREDREDRDLY